MPGDFEAKILKYHLAYVISRLFPIAIHAASLMIAIHKAMKGVKSFKEGLTEKTGETDNDTE